MSEPTPTENAPAVQATAQKKERAPPKPKDSGRGVVKAVNSGDSLTVIHIEKGSQGPPQEVELTLTNIAAPRLGRRKSKNGENRDDDPFAFQSREFLRKKLVGRQISYLIENKDPKSGKIYATVFYGAPGSQPENVAVSILNEGWAKLRDSVNRDRPELSELVNASENAERHHRGVFNKDEAEKSKRNLTKEVNTTQLFDSVKGKPQAGVVESVVTGSRFRITLHKDLSSVELLLSGVEAPNLPLDGEPQPYAREAKFFTEHHLLHRDVQVIVEGADKYTLYGSLVSGEFNISEELLKNGLAKFVEWSAQRTAFLAKLKAAEAEAKKRKLRVWGAFVEPKPLSAEEKKRELKSGREFNGKVTRVINAGAVVITDQSNQPREIFLSSVKIPRSGNTHTKAGAATDIVSEEDRKDAVERTLAWEGKEYIRKKLIDQKVKAVLDYVRPESKRGNETLPERAYYSLYLEKTNIAVELVEHGLATVQPHRAGEHRSRDYEFLLFAEERAKKAHKGAHADPAKAPIVNITDLSQKGQLAKAKQFLPSMKRNGKTKGVVEHVFSGSRFKVYVPREGCLINFILAAARTPRTSSEPGKAGEPFAEESLRFAANRVAQRDVELEVLEQDKVGNFIGTLWVGRQNIATQLIEEGLATTNRIAVKESEHRREYDNAEEVAKRGRKNLWKNYDEAAEEEKRKARNAEREKERESKPREMIDVHVTEILSGNQFYVQTVSADAQKLEEIMKGLETSTEAVAAPAPGQLYRVQFKEDDKFYRAKVTKLHGSEAEVKYIDYGNTEIVPFSRISKLDAAHAALPAQAQLSQLAFLRAPGINEDFGEDSADYLRELVYEKAVQANIEYKENDTLYLTLYDTETDVFVNSAMVEAGLARLEKVRGRQFESLIEKLKADEKTARQQHNGIWQYGDVDSDDDEPLRPTKRVGATAVKQTGKPAGKK